MSQSIGVRLPVYILLTEQGTKPLVLSGTLLVFQHREDAESLAIAVGDGLFDPRVLECISTPVLLLAVGHSRDLQASAVEIRAEQIPVDMPPNRVDISVFADLLRQQIDRENQSQNN